MRKIKVKKGPAFLVAAVFLAGLACCAVLGEWGPVLGQRDWHIRLERKGDTLYPGYAETAKGGLSVGVGLISGDFDPRTVSADGDAAVSAMIFEALLTHDRSGGPLPVLASAYKVSKDGKTYTFTLRKNLKFSDGSPLDAQTVRENFLSVYPELFMADGAITVNGRKIIFNFDFADAGRVWLFSLGLQPTEQLTAQAGAKRFIGTGPYRLDGMAAAENGYVELVANEYYRFARAIQKIRFVSADAASLAALFQAGALDLTYFGYDNTSIGNVCKPAYVDLYSMPGNRSGYMGLNLRLTAFQDIRVRQALAYAIDYERILRIQYGGYADVNPSPFSLVSWATPAGLKPYTYDTEKARGLLTQAGYSAGPDGAMVKEGQALTLTLSTYSGSHARAVCMLIAEDLQAIGVDVRLEQMPYAKLRNKVWHYQDFDAYYANWNYGLTEDIYTRFGQPSADINPEGWYPPEVASLLAQAKNETDFKKEQKIYQKLARLYHEQVPQIPIDMPRSFVAASSALQGLSLSPYMLPCWNVEALSIDK